MRMTAWLLTAVLAAGCASEYSWTSKVPPDMRSVSVPVFRNESEVTELGAVVSRQLLREFQREGTFRIAAAGDGAVEIQGVIKQAAADAGITREVSPHTLRHSFATHLLAGGASISQVQDMLGHESITTTEIYTHVDVTDTEKTLEESHPLNGGVF